MNFERNKSVPKETNVSDLTDLFSPADWLIKPQTTINITLNNDVYFDNIMMATVFLLNYTSNFNLIEEEGTSVLVHNRKISQHTFCFMT